MILTSYSAAEAFFGAFGRPALGYGYAYASPYTYNYAPPLTYGYGYASAAPLAAATLTSASLIAAPAPAAPVAAAPSVAKVSSSVPSVTSTQFHSQDEDGNYAFGYKNINSYRVESGNVLTGVSGSYSDGFRTYNYVADDHGFRHV